MATKVIKTTFEDEQRVKDEAWLKLAPLERLERAKRVRDLMKKPEVNYSFQGLVVRVSKTL